MSYRVAGLLIVTGLAACGSSEEPGEFAAFDSALEGYLADAELTGATAVIVDRERGVLHMQAYGDFELDRVTLIASSSKIISAGVLVNLAEEGVVDLDAPISTYLTDAYGEFKADITIAQLLSNSSGMVGLIDDPVYPAYRCQYEYYGSLAECTETIYTAADDADRVPPDTRWRYGGGQWHLAGGIAAQVTGKTWNELVAETYAPCALETFDYANHYTQAYLEGGVDAALDYPHFFEANPDNLLDTENPNIEGGAYTDITSYAELLLMHVRGGECTNGRVLDEASVARMQEDRIAAYGGETLNPSFAGYGLGWWVSRDRPGVVIDPGAYGALPWIDNERGYGAMVIIEGPPDIAMLPVLQPVVEDILDTMAAP